MRKSSPTRLTESFNEGIYNTKPLKERANRQWARGTLINGLVLRCASHGLLRLSDRINEHVVLYETMIPLIYIPNCSLPPNCTVYERRPSRFLSLKRDKVHEQKYKFGRITFIKDLEDPRNVVFPSGILWIGTLAFWIYLDIDIPTVNQYNVWFVKWGAGMDCYW